MEELWLVRIPKKFDVSLLDGLKLKIKEKTLTGQTTPGRANNIEVRQLQPAGESSSTPAFDASVVNLAETASKTDRFRALRQTNDHVFHVGAPFSRQLTFMDRVLVKGEGAEEGTDGREVEDAGISPERQASTVGVPGLPSPASMVVPYTGSVAQVKGLRVRFRPVGAGLDGGIAHEDCHKGVKRKSVTEDDLRVTEKKKKKKKKSRKVE